MAHQPSRPFESLEWYRDAARNDFRDDNPQGSLSRWARGFGMLHSHICVYAVAIVTLLLVNLLRSPERIWVDTWIMVWTVLVLIHAVAVGIAWAIQQWDSDAPDEPLYMTPHPHWEQSIGPGWGSAPVPRTEAQDVDFRMSGSGPGDEPPAASPPGWTGWNADAAIDDTPVAERPSWKEASAAAWLSRGKPPPAAPDPETDAKA